VCHLRPLPGFSSELFQKVNEARFLGVFFKAEVTCLPLNFYMNGERPTLEKPCIGLSSNKYMYNILKKLFWATFMKLTKIT
jgi:hypothetical protein